MSKVLKETILTQLIAFVVFVGVPVAITAAAPVTWITLEPRPTGVSVSARTCLLFVIPFSTQTAFPVDAVHDKVTRGKTPDADQRRRGHKATPEDQGVLIISGPQAEVRVPCSPVSLPSAMERIRTFVNRPNATPLLMMVVANWKVSVMIGGIAVCFTLLYIVGVTLAILSWIRRMSRSALQPAGSDYRERIGESEEQDEAV